MQWIPRQSGKYILSNIYIWTGHIFLMIVSVFATIRGLNMFENIPEINNVSAMCAVAVIGWIGLIQYSKYVQHIKANIDASETKFKQAKEFAFIPYLIIPVIFGAISVFAGLWVADYTAVRGYFAGAEEIAVIAIVASIIVNCILSKYLVNHIGDAVYFATIENKVAKAVEEFPPVSEEDMKLIAVLKQLRK